MEKGLAWSACLIAAAGTTAIAMIGFSTWRYDVALNRAATALHARAGAATAAELTIAFWQQRQAIEAYMAAPGAPALHAAAVQHDRFQRLAGQLAGTSPGAGETPAAGVGAGGGEPTTGGSQGPGGGGAASGSGASGSPAGPRGDRK